MKYLSVCSGIEAATVAWQPMGWEPIAFSEIDKFPSAVLAHHWPDVPNLGDFTTIGLSDIPTTPDVLVGGTPCQAFSLGGLREGLADPRGNLTLEFLALADRLKPNYVIWENVPGALSADGDPLRCLLDGFEQIGYTVDVDILDAQFFGVAQRRRRVFVLCQRVDGIANRMTTSSAQIIAKCLSEILHSLLAEASVESESGPAISVSPGLCADGRRRRMQLFSLREGGLSRTWHQSLAEESARCLNEPASSQQGGSLSAGTDRPKLDTQWLDTARGLVAGKSASYSTVPSWSTILDACSIEERSCTTSTATSQTADSKIYAYSLMLVRIAALMSLSKASYPTFWGAASSTLTALEGCIKYARQAGSTLFGGMDGVHDWGNLSREAGAACVALGSLVAWADRPEILPDTKGVHGNTPTSTPARNEVGNLVTSCGEVSPTVSARDYKGPSNGRDGFGSAIIDQGEGPRKLAPAEVERLQGLPDNHTQIPWRGKLAEDCPDSHRYKACGNSMAVPCISWLGRRIQRCEYR